jgi:short-subunit dehydrogenase
MTVALDKKRFGPWALVTGASSGIGKEFAQQIAASGINIVLAAREDFKEVGVEFSKRYGVEHRVVVLDVSREDFIRSGGCSQQTRRTRSLMARYAIP